MSTSMTVCYRAASDRICSDTYNAEWLKATLVSGDRKHSEKSWTQADS